MTQVKKQGRMKKVIVVMVKKKKRSRKETGVPRVLMGSKNDTEKLERKGAMATRS